MALANAGVESKTIREVRRDVKFAAADMDVAMRRFAERDDAGVESMHERSER